MTAGDSAPLLRVTDLEVAYGEARALFGVSLEVRERSVTAVLGANGAGKSSLASAIAGVVSPRAGRIEFDGHDITGRSAHWISKRGLAYVPESRNLFPHLSVRDNLWAQIRFSVPREARKEALDHAFELFPVLAERRRQQAGTLSGGEQQMLSLARLLAAPPKLLVADEMSLGLAPLVVDAVFASLERARNEGVTVLLIEQFVERALGFADEAVILRNGLVGWSGHARDAGPELLAEYLGGESAVRALTLGPYPASPQPVRAPRDMPNGPTGQLKQSTMSVSTCSRVAMPSSTTRLASWIIAAYTRFATNPHVLVVSRITTGFLPHSRASVTTASTVASLVTSVRTISASRITTGGEAQCQPTTDSGRVVTSAICAIGNPEVFDARIDPSGAAASRSRNTRCFNSRFSGTASTTSSVVAASSNDDVNVSRASVASASARDTLPRSTPRSNP